ncbi:NADP oxidoreductase [Gulosibacter macacae]|uniref:NADP oxidoreductase n=1 Tax=Gulosibacter macacae TaxID=2488791 RepID=A0A3P3W318_9MICO|nr:NAD-dependent epimerase/dehydratase family protein [Gulosibacter macacae]RRJ88316.1 NADP oxidoreductase [Gulosibacter macacae]
MSSILVVGAGPLGRATTRHLIASGDEVTVATRSGTALPGATPLALDVTDPGFAHQIPAVDAIVAACNFPYGKWASHWPPAIQSLISAAERRNATLVIAGNLYGYGPPSAPMRETDPLAAEFQNGRIRAEVWREARAAHSAGRVRAVEVRGSDYIGATTGPGAHGGDRLLVPLLAGRVAQPLGDPDQPHSWTALDDFGRLLARATRDEQMLGRAWHVPSAPPVSIRELLTTALRAAGSTAEPRMRPVPSWLVRTLALGSPMMRGLRDTLYQFEQPFIIDDSDARTLLDETSTPLAETMAAAVAALAGKPQPVVAH